MVTFAVLDSIRIRSGTAYPAMKYLLPLLLLGLAALEFFHHVHDGHAQDAIICTDPQDAAQRERARALFQQHLQSHR